ncbi:MAG: MBL fold metallo-hydrolase [Chloroflexi bacterium]|nr:MBL fold metallo-hydrolase [Chloroflexota bacterium]
MQVRILGAHNLESDKTRLTSILIDGEMAIDAGSITSTLSFKEQQQITSILLSHHHFDHIRDIATFGYANKGSGTKKVYSVKSVLEKVSKYLTNGVLYPDFTKTPSIKPSLIFFDIDLYSNEPIDTYFVTPLPVNHVDSTVGYEIASSENKTIFYSSDTGPGLSECWKYITEPNLMLIETTLPNRMLEDAIESKHLTPALLKNELILFKKLKNYIPKIVIVHMNPMYEDEIKNELEVVSKEINAEIVPGYENLIIDL